MQVQHPRRFTNTCNTMEKYPSLFHYLETRVWVGRQGTDSGHQCIISCTLTRVIILCSRTHLNGLAHPDNNHSYHRFSNTILISHWPTAIQGYKLPESDCHLFLHCQKLPFWCVCTAGLRWGLVHNSKNLAFHFQKFCSHYWSFPVCIMIRSHHSVLVSQGHNHSSAMCSW